MYQTWCEALLAGVNARPIDFTNVLDCPAALVPAFIHGYYTGHTCCDCVIDNSSGGRVFASTGVQIYQGGRVA